MFLPRPATFLLALVALGAVARGQSLVANLVTNTSGQVSSGGDPFFVIGGRAVFVATGPFDRELYVTDGTPSGTALLRDLAPAIGSSPQDLIVYGGHVLFTADVPGLGRELWRTDGTTAGTELVVDLYPGDSDSLISSPVLYNGFVYFSGRNATSGIELWRTDGTAAGTTLVADLRPGLAGSSPQFLTVVGSALYFVANLVNVGSELHRLDAAGNVTLVADLTPGAGGTLFQSLRAFGSEVLMSANSGSGYEPHRSDGTAAGTFQLADLAAGAAHSLPKDFTAIGGFAVFSAEGDGVGRELYVTDGTVAGTGLLGDLLPGTAGSTPDQLTVLGGVVVFVATDAVVGRELWHTDGTAAGTGLLADVFAGAPSGNPGELTAIGSEVWFSAGASGVGNELWRTDGTPGGTAIVGDLVPGNGGLNAVGLTPFGNRVLFRGSFGNAGVFEPCVTDGTSANTALLDDVNPPVSSSSPDQFTSFGAKVLFVAGSDGLGREPYATDGSPAGTAIFADVLPGSFGSNASYLTPRGNDVFFTGDLFGGGIQLFVAEAAGGALVQLTSGTAPEPVPRGLCANGNLVVFSGDSTASGREPWVSDGTVAGTHELLDVNPGPAASFQLLQENFTTAGGLTFFSANDGVHGYELWVTDGTTAGTSLVADLNVGTASANPNSFVAVGNRVFFAATNGPAGNELWVSDGTAVGTTMVVDLRPGLPGSSPGDLVAGTVAGSSGVFFVASATGTREIHFSDGTAAGTFAITNNGLGQLTPYRDLVVTQTGLFFVHDDLLGHGAELWHTNGSIASTHMVVDIGPGAADGVVPGTLTAALGGSQVLFGATDLLHGLQLWLSDGTAANSQQVTTFGGLGYGAVRMSDFFAFGGVTYFACDEGVNGLEPWIYDPATGVVAFALPYGSACTGTPGNPVIGAAGVPRIGNAAFAVTLSQALPLTLAVPVGSSGSNNILLGGGCRLLLDLPFVLLGTAAVDAAGTAAMPMPVPNDPMLIGASLFFQWVVLDPAGPFLGDFAISGGLQMRMGA